MGVYTTWFLITIICFNFTYYYVAFTIKNRVNWLMGSYFKWWHPYSFPNVVLEPSSLDWKLHTKDRNINNMKSYTLLTSKFILWSNSSTEWGLPLALDPQCLPLYFPPERWCPPATRWHILSLSSSTLMNLKFPTRLCSTPLHRPLAFFATTSITSPFCNRNQISSLPFLFSRVLTLISCRYEPGQHSHLSGWLWNGGQTRFYSWHWQESSICTTYILALGSIQHANQ